MAVGECTHLKPFVTEHNYQPLNFLICHINFEGSTMYYSYMKYRNICIKDIRRLEINTAFAILKMVIQIRILVKQNTV